MVSNDIDKAISEAFEKVVGKDPWKERKGRILGQRAGRVPVDKVVQRLKEGVLQKIIAAEFDCSQAMISQIAKENGLRRRRSSKVRDE
jgi:hypothetical protein